MRTAVVYSSKTGNTEKLAKSVREALEGTECVYFGEPGGALPEADLIFAGFWTDKGTADEDMLAYLRGLSGTRIFLFGTAGFGTDPGYFDRILSRAGSVLTEGNRILAGFMCQGEMAESVRRRYEAMLEQDPQAERAKLMLQNFDLAVGHPDEADRERLKELVRAQISCA